MCKIKNVFVDRDGTLIEDKHYLSDPTQIVLLPKVVTSLQALQSSGMNIFIVTNQSGIGRGYFKEEDFFACQKELYRQLKTFGIEIVETAFCPHEPHENCACRKPNLQMWNLLHEKYKLKPEECAMIGDKKEDVLFGVNANFALSALISSGKGSENAKKLDLDLQSDYAVFSATKLNSEINTKTKCVYVKDFEQFRNFLYKV